MKGKVSTLKFPAKYNAAKVGISQSQICSFLQCKQKWLYYVNGLQSDSRGEGATTFGDICHFYLSTYYDNTGDMSVAIEKFKLETLATCTGDPQAVENDFTLADIVMNGYFKHYASEADTLKVRESEKYEKVTITEQMGNKKKLSTASVVLSTKLDMAFSYRYTPKDVWIMEHKTKGRIDEDGISLQLAFDIQTRMYALAKQRQIDRSKTGEKVKGVVYNIIRKPQIRQKQTETVEEFYTRLTADMETRPEFYFMRFNIAMTPKDLKDVEAELLKIVGEMIRTQDGGLPVYKNTMNCLMPYKCEYLTACATNSLDTIVKRTYNPNK